KRKSRVRRGREPIFLPRKPMYSRVCVARVKRVVHRRLKWLVVRRHRSILQTARHIQPPEAIFMQNKGSVAANSIKAPIISGWSKVRPLLHRKIWNIGTRPFGLHSIPPNQFLAIAPRFAGRGGARSVIYNAAITRPGEAPTTAKIIFRIT